MLKQNIGGYKILSKLGKGGNAEVYLVEKNKKEYAMKFLTFYNKNRFEKKYNRFKREIRVVKSKQKEIKGIIPIIDDYLPNISDIHRNNRPWCVMELGTCFNSINFNEKSIDYIIDIIKNLAITLEKLHDYGIVHRDIKPSNLYFYESSVALGDFGLVDYPETTELTVDKESIGPKFTIAPEMKRNPRDNDGKAADVYSLAKTLWILLTGVKVGFEGQYSYKEKTFNLLSFKERELLAIISKLLEKSTSNSPEDRPKMNEFRETLEYFLASDDDEKMKYEWEYVLNNLFPYGIPKSMEWDSNETIVSTLNELTLLGYLNHMFMPNGGGQDLMGVRISNEPNYIDLDFGMIYKCKPKKLYLETFDNSSWNYFYLELDDIKNDINFSCQINSDVIEVVENTPSEYLESYHWYYKRNMNSDTQELLNTNARNIFLALNGNFCIFNKFSPYNRESSTYNEYQTIFNPDEFKRFIIRWMKDPNEIKRVKELYFTLQKEPYDPFHDDYINKQFTKNEIKKLMSNINLKPNAISDESLLYSLRIYSELNTVYIDENLDIIFKENTPLIVDIFTENDKINENFYGKNDIFRIKKEIEDFIKKFDGYESLQYDLELKRVKPPLHLFNREELIELLKKGDSFKYNGLVINENGNLELIDFKKFEFESKFYPTYVVEFYSHYNSLGEFTNLDKSRIDRVYVQLLNYWLKHLWKSKRISYIDYFQITDPKELENAIKNYYE